MGREKIIKILERHLNKGSTYYDIEAGVIDGNGAIEEVLGAMKEYAEQFNKTDDKDVKELPPHVVKFRLEECEARNEDIYRILENNGLSENSPVMVKVTYATEFGMSSSTMPRENVIVFSKKFDIIAQEIVK